MRKKAKFTVRPSQDRDLIRESLTCYNQQQSESNAKVVDPYGGIGRRAAKGAWGQFAQPLLGYFGGGQPNFRNPEGRRAQRYAEMMANFENSPLGQFAAQYKDFFPGMLSQAQGVGQRIASEAPGIYEQIRGQVGQGLEDFAGLRSQAQQATEQAFNPIANNALYQNALSNMLEQSRAGAAGRGLLDAGSAQGMEDVLGRDLASQFAQNQFAQQQQALATQAGIMPLGAQLAGMGGGALSQLAAQLQQGYGIPAEALQQVFSQLAAFANPTMAVGQMTAPTVATTSRSSGFGIL